MRISGFTIALSVAAGSAMALPALTGQALAVQDQPVMVGGVETVCTGVGSAKDNPAWGAYPVKLVFADPKGQDLAEEHVAVTQDGQAIVETDCDAPWVLMKLPAGTYHVAATLPGASGRSGSASFSVGGSGQKTVNMIMPAGDRQHGRSSVVREHRPGKWEAGFPNGARGAHS